MQYGMHFLLGYATTPGPLFQRTDKNENLRDCDNEVLNSNIGVQPHRPSKSSFYLLDQSSFNSVNCRPDAK